MKFSERIVKDMDYLNKLGKVKFPSTWQSHDRVAYYISSLLEGRYDIGNYCVGQRCLDREYSSGEAYLYRGDAQKDGFHSVYDHEPFRVDSADYRTFFGSLGAYIASHFSITADTPVEPQEVEKMIAVATSACTSMLGQGNIGQTSRALMMYSLIKYVCGDDVDRQLPSTMIRQFYYPLLENRPVSKTETDSIWGDSEIRRLLDLIFSYGKKPLDTIQDYNLINFFEEVHEYSSFRVYMRPTLSLYEYFGAALRLCTVILTPEHKFNIKQVNQTAANYKVLYGWDRVGNWELREELDRLASASEMAMFLSRANLISLPFGLVPIEGEEVEVSRYYYEVSAARRYSWDFGRDSEDSMREKCSQRVIRIYLDALGVQPLRELRDLYKVQAQRAANGESE